MDKIFKEILKKLKGVQFACIGSTNMYLQGIDIQPKDIDFVTDDDNLDKIGRIFKTKIHNKKGFNEIDFKLYGQAVHFASSDDNPLRKDDFKNPIFVEKWGLKIPCMPLASDLKFYQQANRIKDRGKIELIKKKLNSK